MKLLNRALYAGAGVLSLALIGALAAPKVVAAARAALVEIVIPSTPFFGSMSLTGFASQSVGPGTGNLGVTQIVITNFDSVVNQVNIYSPLLTGGTCGGIGNINGGNTIPFLVLKVQPNSTLVVSPGTPIVFTPQDGFDNVNHTCVAAGMPISGGNVYVMINGFVN
jgi:hypothetical protein